MVIWGHALGFRITGAGYACVHLCGPMELSGAATTQITQVSEEMLWRVLVLGGIFSQPTGQLCGKVSAHLDDTLSLYACDWGLYNDILLNTWSAALCLPSIQTVDPWVVLTLSSSGVSSLTSRLGTGTTQRMEEKGAMLSSGSPLGRSFATVPSPAQ